MKPAIILLLVLNTCLHVSSQQKEYIFKNFTQEEGLPSNEAYYVFEDSRHFLWFATDLGVVRYNGSKIEQFNLPDNVVFKIREDSKGRIWFFSHKAQLAYFEKERIVQYKYNDSIAERIKKINIVEAYVDENENITLSSSMDSGYVIHNDGSIQSKNEMLSYNNISSFTISVVNESVLFIKREKTGIPTDTLAIKILNSPTIEIKIPFSNLTISHYGGFVDEQGEIYFFAGKALCKISKNGSFKIKRLPNDILSIEKFNNSVWVGMLRKGAITLENDLSDFQTDTLLYNKSVTSIKKDHEGGIWFSTLENGVFYIKNTNISHYIIADKFEQNTSRLLSLKDTTLLYTNSKGIFELKNNNKSNLFLPLKNNDVSDLIYKDSILYTLGGFQQSSGYETHETKYYKFIKTYVKLISPSEGLINRADTFIYSNSNYTILVKSKVMKIPESYLNGDPGYTVATVKNLLNIPTRLFQDSQGFIWGGASNGLYRSKVNYDTLLKILPGNKILEKGVTCVRQMDNNVMAIGIRFGGVTLLNDINIIANITEKDGLLSNKVRYLLPVKNQLWVATAKGVSVINFTSYNPVRYNIINIGKNDGFYNVTINQLIKFKGDIVAATSNGLYFIKDPDELINREPIPIPFYINSVSYYQDDTSAVESLILPYSKSRVLIRYAAACFNSAEEVKYQYTFSTEDTSWTTTTSTELLLENLEPGDYDFRIKAVILNQNRSSEVQHFHITVEKPWWQNNWLRAGVILAFISAGIFFTRYRIKKVQAEEERKTALNSKIAELEQTALRAQMNPHFIFNCLTSIQQLIVTGNKTEANEYLVKFARLIRKTLDLSANPFISVQEEMEYLAEYMFLEQLRLTGRFEYFIKADKTVDIEKMLIPNMMIQPVVENCIRHGIKSLENRKGVINVDFTMHGKQLICSVKDNGIGRKSNPNRTQELTKHKSYGIDIIEKRLNVFSELNDQQMAVEIKDLFTEDGAAAGTEVILQLPYKTIV